MLSSSSAKKTLRFISVRFFQCRRLPDDNSQARYTLRSSLSLSPCHTALLFRRYLALSLFLFLFLARIASDRHGTNEWVTPRCAHRSLVNRIVPSLPYTYIYTYLSRTRPLFRARTPDSGDDSGQPRIGTEIHIYMYIYIEREIGRRVRVGACRSTYIEERVDPGMPRQPGV